MIVRIGKQIEKDMGKINEPYKQKIKEAIAKLKDYPNISNIKRLKNFQPAFRLRVGDYRIFFDIENDEIYVINIKHRKEAY